MVLYTDTVGEFKVEFIIGEASNVHKVYLPVGHLRFIKDVYARKMYGVCTLVSITQLSHRAS